MTAVEIQDTYGKYYPIIRAKCARILGNSQDAEDAAQETFARLLQQGPNFQKPGQIVSWIYKTGTHLSIDKLRKSQRHQRLGLEFLATEMVDAFAQTKRLELREKLHRLLNEAPNRELETVILHRVDGMTHPEIAKILGCSERTVRRLIHAFDRRSTKNLGEPV